MYVADVIPIAKIPLPSPQTLTYFTSQKLAEYSLVLIPLRKKEVPAIVLSQKKVCEIKMEIKKAEFKLKPILKIIQKKSVLSPYQVELAKWISSYYWAPLGKTISLFLPKFFLGGLIRGKIDEKLLFSKKQPLNKGSKKAPPKLYVAPFGFFPEEEVKTVLENKKQVLFLVPEKSKSNFWIKKFQQTTFNLKLKTNDICFFSTNLPSKKYLEVYRKIKEGKSKIIVGARSALFAPFSNLGLILISEAENKNYKSEMEPRYNAKDAAEKLANILGINLISISSLPPIEDYIKSEKIIEKKEEFLEVKKTIIDMKDSSKISRQDVFQEWSSLSLPLLYEIKKNLSLKRKVLLFLNRKGEALSVVCQDCGWIKKCKNCDVPLIYYRRQGKNNQQITMVCHHCNFKYLPPKECEKCKSWRLITLGSGVEKIEKELKEKFKNSKILRLDSEVAPKRLTQKKILKEFFDKETDILIATSLLFQSPEILTGKKIPLIAVVSLDSLLSLPDFRIGEKGIKIIHNLLSLASDKFILQTFWPNSQIASFLKDGYDSFLKESLKERKEFFYPPFSSLIKLTFSHKSPKRAEDEALNLKRKIERQLTTDNLQLTTQVLGPTPSFIPKTRGEYIWNIVMKFKRYETRLPAPRAQASGGQAKDKRQVLSIVPSQWKIDVDPVSII